MVSESPNNRIHLLDSDVQVDSGYLNDRSDRELATETAAEYRCNDTTSAVQKSELSDRDFLEREQARRALARRSFKRYLYYVFGDSWKRTRMSDFLADKVQEFVETETGNAYDILMIQTPPQHGKSLTITESFPSWYMGRFPKHRIIEASYNEDTAKRFGRKNMEKVEQFGKSLFDLRPGSIWTTTEFELNNGWGKMISRGIMSGITGNPANLMIIDDPLKNRSEADSETYRERLWAEWQNTLKSRLAAGAKVIIIATPWHEDDLMARVLAREPNVTLLRLPVEAEENDLLGRPVGDALAPELGKDNAWLEQFKSGYINDPKDGGLRAWQALYQCSPRVEGGNLVRREWWKYYERSDIPAFATTVISVDATFKDAEDNDFVAIEVWGKLGNNYYLRYCVNQHLNFPSTVQMIRLVKRLFPESQYILVEDKANGSAIIQTLRSEFIGVIAVTPKGGKVARVNAVSPAIESGNVFIPKGELWAEEFVDQFTAFPAGKHDDMCFAAGTMVATQFGDKPIEDVRVGEKVWTPFGLRRVTWAGQTGVRETVTRLGLTGTPDHPVYAGSGKYVELNRLTERINYDTLSLRGVILWTYQRLLCSMALNTGSQEVDDITLVSRTRMKDGAMLKDFTSRFGSFIAERRFLPALKFITKTATLLTTTLATWSVYQCANTVRCMSRRILKRKERIWSESDPWRRSGTAAKRAESGTASTERSPLVESKPRPAYVSSVEKSSPQSTTRLHDSAPTIVPLNGSTTTNRESSVESARSAESSLTRRSPLGTQGLRRAAENAVEFLMRDDSGPQEASFQMEPSLTKSALTVGQPFSTPSRVATAAAESAAPEAALRKSAGLTAIPELNKQAVYNLTVDGSHLYYAGGFLVHNCDAASQALSFMIFSNGLAESPLTKEQRALQSALILEQRSFLSPTLYDVYGSDELFV